MTDLVGGFEGKDFGFVVFEVDFFYDIIERSEKDLLLDWRESDVPRQVRGS